MLLLLFLTLNPNAINPAFPASKPFLPSLVTHWPFQPQSCSRRSFDDIPAPPRSFSAPSSSPAQWAAVQEPFPAVSTNGNGNVSTRRKPGRRRRDFSTTRNSSTKPESDRKSGPNSLGNPFPNSLRIRIIRITTPCPPKTTSKPSLIGS